MSELKKFSEQLSCRIIPVTYDRRVYVEERVVSEEEVCVIFEDKHYDTGETYHDFLSVEAKSIAALSDCVLKELYARGFSSRLLKIIRDDKVALQYSFMSDEPWIAERKMDILVIGDITDEQDHRRDKSRQGKWMTYPELVKLMGSNQAHKIIDNVLER